MTRVLLINGPNLNLLGQREPEIYGTATLDDHVEAATKRASELGIDLGHMQSNHEGEIVDAIQHARTTHDAVLINPGAFSHYAWAIHDALASFDGPVIEIHISNPNAREQWRHTSVVSPVATGSIMGFGGMSYLLAVEAVAALLEKEARR